MKQWKHKLLVVMMLLWATAVSTSAQTVVDRIVVVQVNGDEETFPEIEVEFRVEDENRQLVPGITEEQISISEGNETVSLTSGPTVQNDAGLWIHFVIPGGIRMNTETTLENAQNSIRTFVNNPQFLHSNDHIALSLLEGNDFSNRMQFTENKETILERIDSAIPCRIQQCAKPFASASKLLDDTNWDAAGNEPKIIIYLTGVVEDERDENDFTLSDTDIQQLSEQASQQNVTIYAVVVQGGVEPNTLGKLAVATGGTAVSYNNLESLYNEINDRHRTYYTATYRTNNSERGKRIVVVTHTDSTTITSGSGDYLVDELPLPSIIIENPSEENFILSEGTDDIVVNGRVIFTNYQKRTLASVQFKVDDQPEPQPVTLLEDGSFEFFIPRSTLNESGQTKITVIATDELGLSSEKIITINQPEVITAPPTEPLPITEPEPTVSAVAPTEVSSSNDWLLPMGMILLAVAMIGMIYVNRQKAPVQNLRNTVMRGVERMTKRYQQPTEVKGYLLVLHGDANMGKSLEIYGTTSIGRAKEDADLLFQQQDEQSPISRRHCTILDEEDHFKLRDEDSANGTYLNGVRLTPMEPRELFDGDEIELARVERGGVKIRFQSIQPQPGAATPFDKNTTRAVPRPNRLPNFDQQPGDRF